MIQRPIAVQTLPLSAPKITQLLKHFDVGDGDAEDLETGEASVRWGVQQLGGSDGEWEGDGPSTHFGDAFTP